MEEKKRILKVIEKNEEQQEETVVKSNAFLHPNQTNPIYKNMSKFVNEKIGEKFSLKDLLR